MYEHWHDKKEAASLTGMSVKSIERLAARGEIQQAERPRPGQRPATVYNPDDIARIAAERAPAPFVMPPEKTSVSQPGSIQGAAMTPAQRPDMAAFGTFLEAFRQEVKPKAKQPTRFVELEEASEISGLSRRYLRTAVKAGTLAAVRDGRTWKVRREDLDRL